MLIGVVAALATLVVAAGVAVVLVRMRPDAGDTVAGPGSTQSPGGDSTAPGTPSDSAGDTTSSPDSATTTPSRPRPTFVCWNGAEVTALRRCPDPLEAVYSDTPLAGLNWVFQDRGPRLEAQSPTCRQLSSPSRALHRTCRFDYEGERVCMNWSQWLSAEAARLDYDDLGTPRTHRLSDGSEVLIWPPSTTGSHCARLSYKTAAMVDGELWGVTAYSDDPDVAARARDYFGEFRPVAQWRGIRRRP